MKRPLLRLVACVGLVLAVSGWAGLPTVAGCEDCGQRPNELDQGDVCRVGLAGLGWADQVTTAYWDESDFHYLDFNYFGATRCFISGHGGRVAFGWRGVPYDCWRMDYVPWSAVP